MDRRLLLVWLGLGLACGSPTTPVVNPPSAPTRAAAAAPDAAAPDAANYRDIHRPCVPGSADHRKSAAVFEQLRARVETIAETAETAPINQQLDQLLATPCFRFAKAMHRKSLGHFPAMDSFMTWWLHSGEQWLRSYLDLGGEPSQRYIVIPPTVQKPLRQAEGAEDPLDALICPIADRACGARTLGWAARAESAFAAFIRWQRQRGHADVKPVATEENCSQEALAKPAPERFGSWHDCIFDLADRQSALPLGRLRVPDRGWLIVRGRRGHYSFCDEVRFYDLATGAAFMAKSCSNLALRSDGSVDHGQTGKGRRLVTERGHLLVDNVREAAWMMLLADRVQHDVVLAGARYEVPSDIEPMMPVLSQRVAEYEFRGATSSSGQTRLAWAYIRDGRAIASGELTWPVHYDQAELEHAVQLLAIAEASFRPGCPSTGLPSFDNLGSAEPGVSRMDANWDDLKRVEGALFRSLKAAHAGPCR